MKRITLNTEAGESEILTGENLSAGLKEVKPDPVLIVDENVFCQHNDIFGNFPSVTVPSGEGNKTLQTVEMLYRNLVKLEADRSSLLIGVGGGLVTDVAGFAASTFMRGIRFGFISSTLLGQVDAGIGGKNGVNLDGYKNMIGCIRQPEFIWNDLSLLKTLPRRQYVSGIAEIIKYGAIGDRGFFDSLTRDMEPVLKQDPEILERVVTTSASIKASIVEKDERETGLRRVLNFGHTLGHAIEREAGILHGEAVAAGMVLAARLSQLLGTLPGGEVEEIEHLVAAAGLPMEIAQDPETIYQTIRKDKKKEAEKIHFVLLESLGNAVVREISLSDLKSMLHDLY